MGDIIKIGDLVTRKKYHIIKAYQSLMARRSHLQIPDRNYNLKLQPKCLTCKRNASCNGCTWCMKCVKK